MYLEERDGSNPDGLIDRLLGLLAGTSDWRVVAQHLFARLGPPAQLALLDRLADAVDDPRYISGEPEQLLVTLASNIKEGSALAELLVERAQREGGRSDAAAAPFSRGDAFVNRAEGGNSPAPVGSAAPESGRCPDDVGEAHPDLDDDRQLYQAVADAARSPHDLSAAELAELYRKVITGPGRNDVDTARTRDERTAISETMDALLRARGYNDIALAILDQDPRLWRASEGCIPVLEAYLADRYRTRASDWGDSEYAQHFEEIAALFHRVTTWGARAGMATMPLFLDHIMEAPTARYRCLASLDREVLGVRGNLIWLDRTMLMFHPSCWRQRRSEYLQPLLAPRVVDEPDDAEGA